jgi:ABC-type sugar transport system permease subunit
MSHEHQSTQAAESTGVRDQFTDKANRYFSYLISVPSSLYVLLVIGFPLIYLIYLSVMQNTASVVREPEFVGLEHYIAVVTNPQFWQFFLNTIIYAGGVIIFGLTLQIGIALALNSDLPYKRMWQTLVILPWAIPFAISSLLWRFMFNPRFGLINYLLIQVGVISGPIQWFSSQWAAFATVIMTTIWINTPLAVLILLAGLQTIPDNLYEAARLDGAGVWGRFRHITLPMLRPALSVALLIESLLALRGFDIIYVLTQGGPGRATTVIAVDIYNQLISFGNVGYASAESVILITIILIFLAIVIKVFGASGEEAAGG